MTDDLTCLTAVEAVRRGAQVNVHELWALLEALDSMRPNLLVDLGSGPAVWWAWWSMCPNIIGVSPTEVPVAPAFSGTRLPETVTALIGEPADPATAQRVTDQVARRPIDVLVIGEAHSTDIVRHLYHLYAPKVRTGGMVLVHGIANPARPWVGRFWRDLQSDERQELIGAVDPDGYGVITIPGQVSSNG